MDNDLEMATGGTDSTSTARDAPSANLADTENVDPTLLPGPPMAHGDAERAGLGLMKGVESLSPNRVPPGLVRRILGRRSRDDNRGGGATPDPPERLMIQFLHHYNILWARARLLRHYHEPRHLVDDEVAGRIHRDLHTYSNALRDYQLFQTDGQFQGLFPTHNYSMLLSKDISDLEDMRSKLERLPPGSDEAKALSHTVEKFVEAVEEGLLKAMTRTTCDISRQRDSNDSRDFWFRMNAALWGGLALLIPMTIMLLAAPRGNYAVITTYLFVAAVGIALAILLKDFKPKDILTYTAAYAAVLVVVVGVEPPVGEGT